ncbi:transcriptional regulator [Cronobacter sakazakii]|nr:transcriptional regulator [Cronobacter sakazakii]
MDTIIMKPRRNENVPVETEQPEKQQRTFNRYGSASKLSGRQQIPV